ncbi:ABC transporter ATP-binding protein [Ruminiclostridium herbifermentans]|uniref:ABC transporter ATP-binding protein n=1 Tax=Ruminiclostridium herbifermentans TaxID=2488810 RepID=A0A4V6ENW1_9FIRM|nr:ABC transporter ATP-binding protein [Ruminiclostridium herbifermentans]QNU67045.1 ABC transporter ATP-binding protein [Ruminiclostridium herbifermentans]
MNELLSIKNLSKNYNHFTLDSISFSLPEGYIMGLIGPNGAGKTTTIKLILNMLKKSSGDIKIFGKDHILEEKEIKQNLGVVFDSNYFVDEWKMADVEKAIGKFYINWSTSKFYYYLDRFKVNKSKRVKELSKGMQMKLMLACAFSYDAKLLILDEPTSGLDPVSRDELLDILSEFIKDGKRSVLFSTHITSDLDKIADYITFLNEGKLLYSGLKDKFIKSFSIVKGEIKELTSDLKQSLISLRESATGFEGLIYTNDLPKGSSVNTEPATIDDIIVFINRRGA